MKMHILKVTTITGILSICFASNAFAYIDESNLVCPSVEQIQSSTTNSEIRCTENGNCTYDLVSSMVENPNDYYQDWGFFMDFHAASQAEAKAKAEELLASLVYLDGPLSLTFLYDYSRWEVPIPIALCKYSTSGGADVEATAVHDDSIIK